MVNIDAYMRRATVMLRTVSDVVQAFGGPAETAKWAGHGPSAICNWVARGFIPPGWHYRMSKWAAEHGYEISPAVFGEDDAKPVRKRQRADAHA